MEEGSEREVNSLGSYNPKCQEEFKPLLLISRLGLLPPHQIIRLTTSHICGNGPLVGDWGRKKELGVEVSEAGVQPEMQPDAETALSLQRVLMFEELAWPCGSF